METEQHPFLTLRSDDAWYRIEWGEIWRYRHLIVYLGLRELAIRYKQTFLGFLWAIIQPFVMMIVFTLIFGEIAGFPSDQVPYPIFTYTALLPFLFFSGSMNMITRSIVQNSQLISKVYFPRIVIPLSTIFAPMFDALIAFVMFLILMLFFNVSLTPNILALPLLVIYLLIFALGIGLWLTALNAQYRDIMYILPFLIQILQYLSPVVYPISMVPESWRTIYSLNPMTSLIDGFRWCLIGTELTNPTLFFIGIAVALFLFVTGFLYFQYVENSFADVV